MEFEKIYLPCSFSSIKLFLFPFLSFSYRIRCLRVNPVDLFIFFAFSRSIFFVLSPTLISTYEVLINPGADSLPPIHVITFSLPVFICNMKQGSTMTTQLPRYLQQHPTPHHRTQFPTTQRTYQTNLRDKRPRSCVSYFRLFLLLQLLCDNSRSSVLFLFFGLYCCHIITSNKALFPKKKDEA